MENISVPIIVITCYIIGEIFKVNFKKNEKTYKIIPFLMGLLDGIFGILIFFTNKELIYNVTNIWDALLIGMICGLGSTGTNQLIKQITKKEN